jgi:hypothetical protein
VRLEHDQLSPEDVFGLPTLVLVLGLADAGDHPEPGVERRGGPPADRLVGLTEVLPALRVSDDRAVDAEVDEHRGRDLARVRPLRLPVDVLGSDGDLGVGERLHRRRQSDERRADGDVDALDAGEPVAKLTAELGRLGGGLVHLPVAGDEHL